MFPKPGFAAPLAHAFPQTLGIAYTHKLQCAIRPHDIPQRVQKPHQSCLLRLPSRLRGSSKHSTRAASPKKPSKGSVNTKVRHPGAPRHHCKISATYLLQLRVQDVAEKAQPHHEKGPLAEFAETASLPHRASSKYFVCDRAQPTLDTHFVPFVPVESKPRTIRAVAGWRGCCCCCCCSLLVRTLSCS